MACIPLYFILQLYLLWRLRAKWRIAAAILAVPMVFVLAHAIYACIGGSNIFPLGLIFTSPAVLLYLLVLLTIRRARHVAA